jgi:hypothetical protein
MNAKRSGSFGGSQSVWLTDNRIVGLLNQKVRKIVDTTGLFLKCFQDIVLFGTHHQIIKSVNRRLRIRETGGS